MLRLQPESQIAGALYRSYAGVNMEYRDVNEMHDTELLRELVENRRNERRYLQTVTACIAALTVIIAITAAIIIPKSLSTFKNVNELVVQTNEMVAKANDSLDNIDEMVGNVNGLVEANQEEINDTIEGLSKIDIEALNKSIDNLSRIVSPLANLFGSGRN